MVGGEDGVIAAVLRRLVQKLIPQPPGGLLGGEALPLRQGAGVAASGKKGYSAGGAVIPDELFVPVRLRAPQPVVEMGGGDGKLPLAAQEIQ